MAAKSPLQLYLVVVFVLFASLAAAVLYVSGDRNLRRHARRVGVSRRLGVAVAALGILVPAGLALAGSLHEFGRFAEMGRYEFRSHALGLLFDWALFVGGLLGFAAAAGNARTYYGLTRSPSRDGERVAVSGVAKGDPATTPVRRRPALCWRWRFEVHDPFATGNDTWLVRGEGSDGVPFRVETDAGPVRVDPTDARLDLLEERTLSLGPDESLSDSVDHEDARKLDREHAGNQRRYVESALAPGAAATAVGPCVERADGLALEADAAGTTTIHEGSAAAVRSRYRLRIAAAALLGAAATWFGFASLRAFFGL
ncbi:MULTISPECIES: hypothetical protein [Halorussus]|uniref:hypothetical protein n=1 Tax=Halorussus TaxID=1070314 RepID=UPI00209D0A14|nr:hypothetical protein [Halorussus vallis]USZ77005.1 hypothetical protein NGM07_06670 [Halorussus vallis]